jgi:hypothetical protein
VAGGLRADWANLSACSVYTAPLDATCDVNLVIRRLNSRAVTKADSRERFIIVYLTLGFLEQSDSRLLQSFVKYTGRYRALRTRTRNV